jgi:tRNA(Arg) A34 adenosine deaminase TadA
MVAPRGALDVVVATVVVAAAGNIVGMGPTAPTQAALPVAHSRMLGSKDPEKRV